MRSIRSTVWQRIEQPRIIVLRRVRRVETGPHLHEVLGYGSTPSRFSASLVIWTVGSIASTRRKSAIASSLRPSTSRICPRVSNAFAAEPSWMRKISSVP